MRVYVLAAIVTSAGCSLFGNSPPLDVRYYDLHGPERATVRTTAAGPEVTLALGSVRASEFLRDRIVYREGGDALREYDGARWTEYPEVYMRRTLTNVLYDRGPFVASNARDTPVLDVELLAFEEVRREGGERAGRVRIAYRLRQDERVIASDTITVERSASDGALPTVVASLEDSLLTATRQVAWRVQSALAVTNKLTSR